MILNTPNGPLHYEITDLTAPWCAPAPTIVFCHGVAANAQIWTQWLPVLAPHFRLVRFDTRGFGRSLSAPGAPASTMDAFADDIVAVAAAAGVERFHLIGESIGGTISLHLAARAGSPVLTLSCVSTAHRGARIARVRDWRTFVGTQGMGAWSKQMMTHRFHEGALSQAQWDWFDAVQSQTGADPTLDAGDLLVNTDLSDEIASIRIPTLLLTPDASPFVTVEISTEVLRLIPNAEMAVIPNSRHGLPFSHARECAGTVLSFLRRHGHAPAAQADGAAR